MDSGNRLACNVPAVVSMRLKPVWAVSHCGTVCLKCFFVFLLQVGLAQRLETGLKEWSLVLSVTVTHLKLLVHKHQLQTKHFLVNWLIGSLGQLQGGCHLCHYRICILEFVDCFSCVWGEALLSCTRAQPTTSSSRKCKGNKATDWTHCADMLNVNSHFSCFRLNFLPK